MPRTGTEIELTPPPLPGTAAEMEADWLLHHPRNLTEDITIIHKKLWDYSPGRNDGVSQEMVQRYRKLLEAVQPSKTVEGSFRHDNDCAAMMVREYAVENDFPQVAGAQLRDIEHSLKVVCRRYRVSRKQRLARAVPVSNGNGADHANGSNGHAEDHGHENDNAA